MALNTTLYLNKHTPVNSSIIIDRATANSYKNQAAYLKATSSLT